MKRVLMVFMSLLIGLLISIFSVNVSAEDLSNLSVIQNSPFPGEPNVLIASFLKIDDESFYFSASGKKVNVPPGNHQLRVSVISKIDGKISSSYIVSAVCATEAGYVYTITPTGCSNDGRRMDFAGATDYWDKFDEDRKQKAVIAEAAKYQADKFYLTNAKSKNDILNVISSVEQKMRSGINRDDPDDLLGQAKQHLAPYLLAEADTRNRDRIAREKDVAERAKNLADRQQKEQQQALSFRKYLAEGDETSCGLVVEKKARLVKIQLKSSNSEKWVKLDEVYPVGQTCHLVAGDGSMGDAKRIGQKICRDIQTNYSWAGRLHSQTIRATGFVENVSGQKLQIRISGMVSIPNGTNVNRIDGDVVIENGSVIWDGYNNWTACN